MFEFKDDDLKKEMHKKKYSYKELHDFLDIVYTKLRRSQYIWIMLTGLLSPLLVPIIYKRYPNLIGIFSGAITFTFLAYLFDNTMTSYCDYKVKRRSEFKAIQEKEKDDE